MSETKTFVYVGTYTRQGGEGIYVYAYDAGTGELSPLSSASAVNPSFLALHPTGRFLYAVNEMTELNGEKTGAVSSFAIDPATGALTFLNQQHARGAAACHLSVDKDGQYVYVANYGSGTAAVFPVNADGSLLPASDDVQHAGSGPDARRQGGPHAHSINLDPAYRFAYVPDLGIDRVMIYDITAAPGKLTPADPPYVSVSGGRGPRHFTFTPDGTRAYLITEMGNTIVAFTVDVQTGALTELQEVPTLPADFVGRSTCADIHLTPDGRFLYGSNRGHDSLVIYAVDASTGLLSYVGHQSTLGKTPRNFAISPDGNFLLAANQDSDNIVLFRIDQNTGLLTPTGFEVKVSMPVNITFYQH